LITTEGHVKTIDLGSICGEKSAFLLAFLKKEKTYLAPEVKVN
jgi:hypothetical protein